MGKHYVPQAHLRRFSVKGNPKLVWLCDKKQRSFKPVSIKKAAQTPDFYTPAVEAHLAKAVELPGNIVIDKLHRRDPITDDERTQLSLYILTMLTRGPRHRRRAAQRMPDILEKTVAEVRQMVELWAQVRQPDTEKVRNAHADIDRTRDRLLSEPPPDIVQQIRTPMESGHIVASISQMTWHLYRTNGPSFFVTGDSPVHTFEWLGVARRESELTFPMSSTLALFGEHTGKPSNTFFREADQKLVKELNRRIISHAERLVFYHDRHEWVEKLAYKAVQLNKIT